MHKRRETLRDILLANIGTKSSTETSESIINNTEEPSFHRSKNFKQLFYDNKQDLRKTITMRESNQSSLASNTSAKNTSQFRRDFGLRMKKGKESTTRFAFFDKENDMKNT